MMVVVVEEEGIDGLTMPKSSISIYFDIGSLCMSVVTSKMRLNSDHVAHLTANESLSAGRYIKIDQGTRSPVRLNGQNQNQNETQMVYSD